MTTEQKTQFIIEKCIGIRRVCNDCEKVSEGTGYCECGGFKGQKMNAENLNLEDILMAWDKKAPKSMKIGKAMEIVWGIFCEWHFGKPFTSQSEELKNFVYEILKDE